MPVASVPFVVTQPGAYVVVGNLGGGAGGISVQASNVTIDLNGFTLTGSRTIPENAISVAAGSDNVTIQNGLLRQWGGDGVHAPGVTDLRLRNVRVVQCAGDGVEAGSATLRDVTVADNDGAGIRAGSGMGAGKVSLQDFHFVRATGNGGGGIAYVGPCDASASDCLIFDNTGHGLAWSSSAADESARVRLERCAVDGNTGSGLHISEASAVRVVCSARSSTFLGNGGDGLAVLLTHADSGLQLDLSEGSASGNGGNGLNVQEGGGHASQCTIDAFSFDGNALAGAVRIDGDRAPGRLTGSTARGNGGAGLALQGGLWTIAGSEVSDNGDHGIQAVMGNCCRGHVIIMIIDDTELARNAGAGVSVEPDAGDTEYRLDFRRLDVSGNTGSGLQLTGAAHLLAHVSSISSNKMHGVKWTKSPASSGFRVSFDGCDLSGNVGSGLYVSESTETDVDCSLAGTAFHRNGGDGLTLLLTHAESRLAIDYRGGGACDNGGHGLNLAAGRNANQGFFDIALSRNAGSGCNKIDAGASPGTMERVVAQGNAVHGLDLSGGTWSIGRCVASDNTGSGIVMSSRHVKTGHVTLMKFEDCTAERNGGDGLYVHTAEDDASYKVSMQDMHLRSNAGDGLRLSCDNALCSVELDAQDSAASANAACGVKLIAPVAMDKGLRFRVKGGDCDDNAQGGIFVDDSAAVRSGVLVGCVLRNNGAAGFRAPGGALRLERCVAADNAGDGFLITRPPLSGSLYQSSLSFDDCEAVHNGGSGIVVAGFDATTRASVSVSGGKAYWNVALGIDLSSSTGARGRVHGVHLGDNGTHGLLSAAASLDVSDNQFTGNAGSGLHVLSGAHRVARNVCADNAVGVHLAAAGSTVLQNTFSGGAGGLPQVPVEDVSGACDVAPAQNAASGTNPLGNMVF